MALIQVRDFSGIVPRVSPRALGPNGAQKNENLLATSTEMRPLQGDKTVGVAPSGVKTLYRLSRDSQGALRTDDTTGWIAETRDKNYVKGQLNDDATERTLVSFNDGEDKPRVIDATGEDRLLGVPAPPKLSLSAVEAPQFTGDDARAWIDDEAIPAFIAAVHASLFEDDILSRLKAGNVPTAGPYSLHGLQPHPSVLREAVAVMTDQQAREAEVRHTAGYVEMPNGDAGYTIELMPFWGTIDNVGALRAALQAIESPADGSQVLSEDSLNSIVAELQRMFDPAGDGIKSKRDEMDTITQRYAEIFNTFATGSVAGGGGGGGAPDPGPKPQAPYVPEWRTDLTWNGMPSRDPQWVAYYAALADWEAAHAAWEAAGGQASGDRAALLAEAADLRFRALGLSNEIEDEYFRRKNSLESWARGVTSGEGFWDGLNVDPDRIIETRFYVATYVTDWGWESAPSPVSDMVEIDQNDSVTVTITAPPPNRDIEKWRLYRSNTGSAVSAFQFVDEMLIATPTFSDDLKGEQLGEVCPTLSWLEPPYRMDMGSAAEIKPPKGNDPYLRGLVGMPNGVVAGFIDNFVAFAHPYHPYAWPVEYQITTEHPIVGLGVFGQTLFVGTLGNPYLISGADSASMSADKMPFHQACVSRRSIVGVGSGVIYASPDGLCLASPGGVEIVTQALFSREDWQALEPEKIIAAEHERVYYFWTPHGCFALDFVAQKLVTVDAQAEAVFMDILDDHLYAAANGSVKKLFAQGRRTGVWRSGVMVFEKQAPLAWLQADGDHDANSPATVRWYADGQLRYTKVLEDIEPVRLPPGRWLEHEIEVETEARVTSVTLAGSTLELQGVG